MDKKAKGQHAERLLADEVLQDAFNVVKEYHTRIFSSPAASDDEVLAARRDVLSIRRVEKQLARFVSDGKLEMKGQDRGSD